MSNIYEECPVLESEGYILRLVDQSDAKDLYEVYSDKNALPFFNSDNCNGDNFYCETEEGMKEAIKYWRLEYTKKGFVRFTIIDKMKEKAIGMIELFRREADDYFNDCGFLRLDVKSSYENREPLEEILSLIQEPAYELFDCSMIATKAAIYAVERIKALKMQGFEKSKECLVGYHDHRTYYDYWVIRTSSIS